jgi:hypothetical protein
LLADFAPLVEPGDFPIAARRAELFSRLTIDRHDLTTRPVQHYMPGGLARSIEMMFPNEKQANDLETATALHALFRTPVGALTLAFKTFCMYFDPNVLRRTLEGDEGTFQQMSENTRNWLQNVYSVSNPKDFQPSLTKSWHMAAWPWYPAVLCVLCASPLMFLVSKRRDWPLLLLCVVTSLILLEGAVLTVDRPTPRFLTADAWLVLLLLGVASDGLFNAYSNGAASSSPVSWLKLSKRVNLFR